MLMEISRFNELSVKVLDDPHFENYSVAQYIKEFHFSKEMLQKYLIPMSSAVWSTPMDKMLDFPIVTLIRFFKNHGFLGLNTQLQWYTLEKGSQSYREILIKPFKDRINISQKVVSVAKQNSKTTVTLQDGSVSVFDKVIMTSHADQSLKMLAEPTADEKRLLSPFKYQKNTATVHSDESVMPQAKNTWSSWNYRIDNINGELLPTTIYWMNRLQEVSKIKNYFVSINAFPGSIRKEHLIQEIVYEHPLFDVAAINAQKELKKLNENGPLYFCGSYFNYGFHEDAYTSALHLCENL